MRGRRGFTLIELMIVIIVISIMAALAVPQFRTAAERARISNAMANLDTIRKGQGIYHTLNSSYTADYTDLIIEIPEIDTFEGFGGAANDWDFDIVAGAAGIESSFVAYATRQKGAWGTQNCQVCINQDGQIGFAPDPGCDYTTWYPDAPAGICP